MPLSERGARALEALETNRYDTENAHVLFVEAGVGHLRAWGVSHVKQKLPIVEAREIYESKFFSVYPHAGRYWTVYIEHELREG